jgi:hypothetical protein
MHRRFGFVFSARAAWTVVRPQMNDPATKRKPKRRCIAALQKGV